MRTLRLGRTGVEVAAVGFGTWPLGGPKSIDGEPVGWAGADDDQSVDALVRAFELGIRHYDTADVYGDGRAEELIGRAFARGVPRDQVFLASKVGWDPGGREHFYHPDVIRDHFERSCRLMGVETIDLYYLHHCDFGEGDRYLDDALECLGRLRDAGKIRFLGLSDWDNAKVAARMDRVDPDVVQVYRNLLDDTYEESGLKEKVREKDCGVAFFSPLLHGLLLGKYDAPVRFPEGDVRNRVPGFQDADLIASLRRARDRILERFEGVDEPVLNAVVSGILMDEPNACALLGLRNRDQVERAAKIQGELGDDDFAFVRDLYRDMRGSGGLR